MKKFLTFLAMAAAIFSLSGCGSGGGGNSSSNNQVETSYEVKQVAVLTSPAFEINKDYKIYTGATLSDMGTAQYYVANIGDESTTATLNLGLSEALDANSSLAVVNSATGAVVFAYNPSGTYNTWKTGGNVRISDGRLMRYRTLSLDETSGDASSVSTAANLDIEDSEIIYITLNGTSAKMTNPDYDPDDEESTEPATISVTAYDYVWHCDPSHRYEYYTNGINGSVLGSYNSPDDYIMSDSFGNDDVYIARDIRYITSSATFSESQTATKDGETEYASYYSNSVNTELEEEYGEEYAGPYIFATLPKTQNSSLSTVKSLMTHSASDAYKNPVLHITTKGIYSLSGTWTGQISIEADAIIILNGVTVTCTVAPAIIFNDPNPNSDLVYSTVKEYGDTDETSIAETSTDVGQNLIDTLLSKDANLVVIADGSENVITGSNVYRILAADYKSSAEKVDGTDISDQVKLYKMDGAFYSYVSFGICGGSNGTGTLKIKSTSLEGLGSEVHLTVDGGVITVEAPDDGINVNEDNISVFTMLDGTLNITSTGGDGIDSNGYAVIHGGTLNITAGNQKVNSAGEAGIDSECGYYISGSAAYNWTASNGNTNPPDVPDNPNSGDVSPDVPVNPNSGDVPPDVPTNPNSGDVSPDVPVNPNSGDVPPDVPTNPTSSDTDSGTDSSSDTSTDSDSSSDSGTDSSSGTSSDSSTDSSSGTSTDSSTDSSSGTSTDSSSGTDSSTDSSSDDFDWATFWENWNGQYSYTQTSTQQTYTYSDADVLKSAVQTERGVTAINIGTGSGVSFIAVDTDTRPRNINTSGNVFRLNRKVNTFSGIVY